MPYKELSEIKIFYIFHKSSNVKNKDGENKCILLIHGAGGNHLSMLSIFNYIKKNFGKTFNILVPDLPFHFRSLPVDVDSNDDNKLNFVMPENDGISFYAKSINSVVEELVEKGAKITLIGHSMGAQVCLKYAALFPENTEKIMLIAGCHDTGISDSFIRSLENSFDRTIMLFLKDALGSRDKNILKKALADIKRTPDTAVVNDFKYSQDYGKIRNYKKDVKFINENFKKILFYFVYSEKDLIIKQKCIQDLSKKIINSVINNIPAKNHIDFLYGNYSMEKEIDKFLLT
ncbi:MAG: alpha/beta hydrolase [Candidatus Acidulodesulfobacterium acidiphilum]|uniref:Alpha/beta hydrolase n=1 Tax=Candidatus Acidulodesulfobacterium acidiphilum TaxID=2597224 RepID=A0A520XEM6_9DELT|nr:MAG: alpha/beta hydrolase [Candidatus Acidulodesulfobacterium acidiphilum]